MSFRAGTGYDAHRLARGRALILGGVHIPHPYGLLGHSDADVLIHSIMDALLGAAGMDDIGALFPDTDDAYRGISSLALLAEVYKKLTGSGYSVINIDSTIIAQAPKLRPYIPKMRENTAKALSVPFEQINIKATTEEGLGFTGTREGIAAQAVCLITKNGGGIS